MTDVYVLGRRGPAQASFTPKELRELGELDGVDVVVHPDELVLDAASEQARDTRKDVARNLAALTGFAERPPGTAPRRIHLRFLLRPVEVLGTDRVEGLRVERTELDGSGSARGTGHTEVLGVQMVLRSVGYRGIALPGVPFVEGSGTIPSEGGRVLRDGRPSLGEYVTGWVRRGPTGVVGTNRSDAAETVASLLADAEALAAARPGGAPADAPADPVPDLLASRGVQAVTLSGWQAIDEAELGLGRASDRTRVKIASRDALLAAGRQQD